MLQALAAVVGPDDVMSDPVREMVVKFLLTYLGITAGVSFLVEGLKQIFKRLQGKEPILVILLSFVIGTAAKALIPNHYGPNTLKAWGFHELILVFVAIGSAAFHDKFLSVLQGMFPWKKPEVPPPQAPPAGTSPPAPPATPGSVA